MGIFSSLGRKTEQLKQKVTSDTKYRCLDCEEILSEEFETCPHCGSETVVPVE